jgi:RHS repeat-associated protein
VTSFRGHGYTYNLAGNMVSSTNPSTSYKYDGHKRRVQKTESGQTSYTMYSSSGTLMHKKVGGVSTDYIYAGSMLLAEKSGSTVDYMHTDLLGSPIKGTNGSSYTEYYTPWGEKWLNPIQLSNDVGYTGHQSDIATGLTYMQARYYDPVIGRFLAVDPVQFGGGNPNHFGRYQYAYNNPIKFTDPDGRAGVLALSPKAAAACAGPQVVLCAKVAVGVAVVGGAIYGGYKLGQAIGSWNESSEEDGESSGEDEEARERIKELVGDSPKGEDLSEPPGEDWTWKGGEGEKVGGDKGAWVNEGTGEQIHNDLDSHKPGTAKGPHITYTDPDGNRWDYFPENDTVDPL